MTISIKVPSKMTTNLAKRAQIKDLNSPNLEISDETKKSVETDFSEDESDSCLICAGPMSVTAISPCNHTTCYLCAFRQRKLYKKNQCLICRTESKTIIFTDNYMNMDFDDIPKAALPQPTEGDLGIMFTSDSAKGITYELLEYKCPLENCRFHEHPFPNFKQLNEHAQSAHSKFFCSICGNANKSFPSELKMYSQAKLRLHMRQGDYDGFEGHPACKFCDNLHFYSDDELNIHMRDKHERCDVCHRQDSVNPKYFRNVEQLSQHFLSAHYPCRVASCLAQKVIVFGELLELEAHMAKEHPNLTGGRLNFGHQLSSTFNKSTKEKSASPKNTHTSMETKRRRFEIRAKHYLSNDKNLYDQFVGANEQFTKNRISAKDLQSEYNVIFKKGLNVDIPILLFEFSELFPEKSKERLALVNINKSNMNAKKFAESYPSLPVPGKTFNSFDSPIGTWNGGSKVQNRTGTKFPTLATSSSATSLTNNSSWGSNSNTKKKLTRGISSTVPINGHSVPGYAPVNGSVKNSNSGTTSTTTSSSYLLNRPINTVNSRSLSSLNLSTASWGSAPAPGSSLSSSSASTTRGTDPSLFPSLPKPKPKVKAIPRVNPVDSRNGTWGSSTLDSPVSSNDVDGLDALFDSGLKIKVRQNRKNKRR